VTDELDKPAFYAVTGGGWRDWWTLLHPPYTIWHLSYVAIGAAAGPSIHPRRLVLALIAFFLAVGIGAHALDELNGRPLRTHIPAVALWSAAVASIAGAVVLGALNLQVVGLPGIPFIAFGGFIVLAYNLEWMGGRFHTDLWFALAWGGFPAFVGYWANSGVFHPVGLVVAAACTAISLAQRALSTPVRALRRRTRSVTGTIERTDGTIEAIDRAALTEAPERALRALSYAMPALAIASVLGRVLSAPAAR
jgi:hypothetical protein